ncbi:carabin isoform X4 [Hippopotamus amphibius kiboko]|uniref:carabin isoform X4 n=1 Tax=Hippopotamus amphibius kiboko TaxID=575201 RepID=UPI0025976257|nr:carabin isoform X4 [Hippopotamus amphibius kiboko]
MAQALGEDLLQPGELQDDSSSLGSDSELSGPGPYRQADRYGFIGGSSAEPGAGHPPADLIRQREMKWVEMTSHWEKTMSRRYKKVKIQCRKGIPSALRARCWPLLCGAHVCQKNSPDTYKALAEAPGEPQWMETIGRDLHRQFPLHEMFVSPQGHGQQGLLQVLKAYTLYRPEQGYCQAQGPVAAVLLMHLPPEEAFWCLVQICEIYLPGYYGPHMEAVRLDAEVFMALLRRLLPRVHKHLQQVGVGPLLYLPEWFLCLFARSLPFPTVLRVWDAFLSEGRFRCRLRKPRADPALSEPLACRREGAVSRGADVGAPGTGHHRTAPGLPGAPGDTWCPSSHPTRPAAGGGLHAPGAQCGPV